MVSYRLHLVYSDCSEVAETVTRRIRSELADLFYDLDLLQITSGDWAPLVADTIACGLFIGSRRAKEDDSCLRQINEMQAASVPIVPLLRENESFAETIPDALHPISAVCWEKPDPDGKIVTVLLRLLGLTEKHRRLFVSYRRSDALRMGEQIWEVLSKAGFEVFLDRFYVDPGIRFQDRLTEALSDKSFVLFVESPEAVLSKWVDYEMTYALKHRLGLLVLTWPQTVAGGHKVGCVDDSFRVFLNDDELNVTGNQGEFEADFLNTLPSVVEEAHARAMLHRRRQLMSSLQRELARFGINYKLISDWSLVAEIRTRGAGGGDEILSITPRPPEIPDLFSLHGHCTGRKTPATRGVLIHTVAAFPQERQQLFNWVVENRNLTLVEEDQVVQLVEGLATGA